MTSENKTWVAGLVGVAVGATVAVLIFLVSQPSASRDQATGAIGAAERYRSEQIRPGDTGIAGAVAPASPTGEAAMAEMLGRAVAQRQAEALNKAAMELKDSMWAKATPDEKMAEFLKAAPETQRAIVDRVDNKSERTAIERVVVDRTAYDRALADVGRVPAETWNKAGLELKDSMWANATPLERIAFFLKADAVTQNKALERMDEAGRFDFQRMMDVRAAQDRVANEY